MEKTKNEYVKRTQKDYTEAFKLQVVSEVENGEIGITAARRKYGIQGHNTIRTWIEKYGIFDKSYQINKKMKKSPEQELMELRQQIKLLEKKNKRLEKELNQTDKKALFFDMMIDIAEEEFKIPIRKKSLSEQSTDSKKKKA
jgi:transposase-like protein